MLNYERAELSMRKIRHGKECLFSISTALTPIGVWLTYNIVLVSGVQQSESVIHINISIFFSHIGSYRREWGSGFSFKHSALKTPSDAMLILRGAGPMLVRMKLTSLSNNAKKRGIKASQEETGKRNSLLVLLGKDKKRSSSLIFRPNMSLPFSFVFQ